MELRNRRDKRIRLAGLTDARYTEGGKYISFSLPGGGSIWPASEWEIVEKVTKCEPEPFRIWLRKAILSKGFTPTGLGVSLRFSPNWLWNILDGRRTLPERRYGMLEKAMGLPAGTISEKKRVCTE